MNEVDWPSSATLRGRYPHAGDCECTVSGEPLPPSSLAVRPMNFGQPVDSADLVLVDYRIRVPLAFIMDYLTRELPDYVADAKEHPDGSDALEAALRTRGWPSPREIVCDPEVAVPTLEFFGHDVLLRWLGDGAPDTPPGFTLNTIGRVGIGGSCACFEGQAFPVG